MTYNTSIPAGSHTPSQDQPLMQANFLIANQTMGANHVPMTDGTTANRGKHNLVTLVQQTGIPSSPGPSKTEGIVYGNKDTANTITAPFYASYNGTSQIAFSVPVVYQVNGKVVAASTPVTILDLNSPVVFPAMSGWIFLYDNGNPTRTVFSPFVWTGSAVFFPGLLSDSPPFKGQVASGNKITGFSASGTKIQINTDSAGYTVNFRILGAII